MNIEWESEKYANDFSFVPQYGKDLIKLLDKDGAKSVLDLGCGSGLLTKSLLSEGFSVVGIDASSEQIELAKNNYPEIKFYCKDATDFSLDTQVDAVFSNAVIHWIDKQKQPKMLSCVYNSLNSGGQFVFELGGKGNTALIHGALRKSFEKRNLNYNISFYFPSIGEYTALLEKAGFKVELAMLFDRPTSLKGDNGLADWIKMFIKEPFEQIPEKIQDAIIKEAVNELKPLLYKNNIWFADYVRLRCKAIKV